VQALVTAPGPQSGIPGLGGHTPRPDGDAETPPAAVVESRPAPLAAAPWVVSTYFAQGLPYSIVHQVSAQLFTALGASLGAIGLTSLYGLAWNLKFAWSPLVDRFGTTRRWLWVVQAALGVSIGLLAWPAGRGDLVVVARALVLVALLAATHDIAIDGFYIRGLGKSDQAALAGVRVVAYRVALLTGKGLLVALAGWTSWFWCFFAAGAILLALSALHAFLLPKPSEDERRARGGERGTTRTHFVEAFRTFLGQERIALTLGFLLLYRAGDALMFAMNIPFLARLGLGTAEQGMLSGVGGTLAFAAGSMAGAALIARRGLRRMLVPIAAVQSLAIPLYVWLAWAQPTLIWVGVVVLAEQIANGIGTAAFVVFIMQRCFGGYKASHFAMASALMSVAATACGSASGYIAEYVGFTAFFALAFVVSVPGVMLARWVPTET